MFRPNRLALDFTWTSRALLHSRLRSWQRSRGSQCSAACSPAVVETGEERRSSSWLWTLLFGFVTVLVAGVAFKPELFRSLLDQLGLDKPSINGGNTIKDTDPNLAAVKVLVEDGRYDKARDQLQTMVSNQPANPDYHLWLGRSYLELKDYPEAIRELNESIKLDPAEHETFEYLARAYEGVGEREKARETRRNAPPPAVSPLPQPTSESR